MQRLIIIFLTKTLRAHAAIHKTKTKTKTKTHNYEIIVLIVLDWSKQPSRTKNTFYRSATAHERKSILLNRSKYPFVIWVVSSPPYQVYKAPQRIRERVFYLVGPNIHIIHKYKIYKRAATHERKSILLRLVQNFHSHSRRSILRQTQ